MEIQFFLGCKKDSLFEIHLKNAHPYLASLLTSGDAYLQEVKHEENFYLGKFLSSILTLEELESIDAHVMSLLRKLVPLYPFSENSLIFLTIPSDG